METGVDSGLDYWNTGLDYWNTGLDCACVKNGEGEGVWIGLKSELSAFAKQTASSKELICMANIDFRFCQIRATIRCVILCNLISSK